MDEFGAKLLVDILDNPDLAPNPRLNPFNPVGIIDNLHTSLYNFSNEIKKSDNVKKTSSQSDVNDFEIEKNNSSKNDSLSSNVT